MTPLDPNQHGRALDRLATRLAHAEGRRDALTGRCAVLEREVALAKARLAVRDRIEAFVEEVQAEASRRNLASFEALLTAFVQEVLPGEKPVSLELSTERGLAALDIGVRRPDGAREDVLEDNGGALTNVVGAALRLIAVVKAGVGRFLALDEADCWIAPDRVPAFYRVLEDGAARLGVQCLAISHHDVSRFDTRCRVSRIHGEPGDGVGVLAPEADGAWDDEALGFRFVRLRDVQAYKDATLTLGPGVNALVGPNNKGKSTFIRALRAVFYGDVRDSLVRAGAAVAVVEIGVAKGRTLRFVRQPKRTPVNIWSLHEADGTVVEERGVRLETGGRAVPAWVEETFGITKVEQLDVHVAHQKFPVFLLGEPPSRRSAVLSIGQEAGYLRDMLAIHRERCTRDMALVRNGERELGEGREALARFEALPSMARDLEAARDRLGALDAARLRSAGLEAHAETLAAARARLEDARRRAAALHDLPGPETLAATVAALQSSRERERVAERLLAASRALDSARGRLAALADLPAAPPVLDDTAPARRVVDQLSGLAAQMREAEARREAAERGMNAVATRIAELVEEMGGLCPTCGAPVEPAALLDVHAHA